ncbi:hypothetical protein ACTQ33_01550 [Candidatus Avoscillospira sp. LCP25S3_F1]|uniref:hypothetical protein n=1 Tax=Candidatus Avoscillospira sp. LCP25S3_F1 TaxID=3438825 RepID=UPI003F92BDC7
MDLFPDVTDPTGHIVQTDSQRIALAPGYYLVSYKVSAIFSAPNYLQVTPSYNGTSHLEYGIYFATTAAGSSACGSGFFIIQAPSSTVLTFNYSGSADARDGEINVTILKLNRPL